jgi:hypothetical protein
MSVQCGAWLVAVADGGVRLVVDVDGGASISTVRSPSVLEQSSPGLGNLGVRRTCRQVGRGSATSGRTCPDSTLEEFERPPILADHGPRSGQGG